MIETVNNPDMNNSVHNFLRLMSHEIRTPLNAVIGGISLFGDDVYAKHNMEYFRLIDFGANRLLQLVRLITDIVHINSDDFIITPSVIQVMSLINNLEVDINKYSDVIDKPTITLQYEYDTSKQFTVDEDILFKILYGLCNNIVLSCTKPQIKISLYSQEKNIICRVEELGKGIPIEKIRCIHNPNLCLTTTNEELFSYEHMVLYNIMINELLKRINSKIEIITNTAKGVIFQFCIPEIS